MPEPLIPPNEPVIAISPVILDKVNIGLWYTLLAPVTVTLLGIPLVLSKVIFPPL